MARPLKNTVEYFPHFVKSGRTVFILESRFGNDGYAFWFKLLEILGESEGHSYDCSDTPSWAYLVSKARVTDEQAEEIISLLVDMGKIDRTLWEEHRVIWVDNFVRNLFGLYKMRHAEVPLRPEFSSEKPEGVGVFTGETPEGCAFSSEKPDRGNYHLVKESKVKESKVFIGPLGKFCNVLLTEEEYNSLQTEVKNRDDYIERLSNYIEKTGKKYKSHYAAILSWFKDDVNKQTKKETLSIETSYNIDEYKEKTNKQTLKYERKNYNENHA